MINRRRLSALLAAAFLVTPLAACSAIPGSSSEDLRTGTNIEQDLAAPEDAADGGERTTAESQLIKTGSVSIEVSQPDTAADDVSAIAEKLGGQVESHTVVRGGEGHSASASLTLRVPADHFDSAFAELAEVGDVLTQDSSAVDVTTEYVDLEARVAALETSVDRLSELMERSGSTAELIEAESALTQRQQELDGLRAQLTALEDQVALATIEVSLTTASALPGGPSTFWEGLLAGSDSLIATGAGALVLLGLLLPWLAVAGIIAALVIFVVRQASRRRRARTTVSAKSSADAAMPVSERTEIAPLDQT